MKQRFETLEQAQTWIDEVVNPILGFPNDKNGTLTYSVPEIVEEKDENGNVVETTYEVPITSELYNLLNPITNETENETTGGETGSITTDV